MNVKSYALCLLAVGFLLVSQAASPSEWTQLQPLSPSLPMTSGLDGNGKPALLPGGFRPSTSSVKTILFIDPSVADADTLLDGLDPSTVVLRLNAKTDGLSQMADALAGYSGLDAIHILSHGSTGKLFLGSSTVNRANLVDHATQLAKIGEALSENGDILLYGCDVAQGETGNLFIRSLAQYTGADVAASTNFTGYKVQGGDWVLEASTGMVEAGHVLAEDARRSYSHFLGVSDYELAQMSEIAYGDNPSFGDWVTQTYTYFLSPGFFAVEFIKDNDIVLAFRGTDGLFDGPADIALGNPTPDWDTQFFYALETANQIREVSPNAKIYVTGHSLGGALAQVVSEMFGFSGATFDPGGAQNIASSPQFTATGIGMGILIPVRHPSSFINYTIDGSAVSSWSGAHIGSATKIANSYVEKYFTEAKNGTWYENLGVSAYEQSSLHTITGIVQLMYIRAMTPTDPAPGLQPEVTASKAAAVNGDIGVSNAAPDLGPIEFYSSKSNSFIFANNRDNIIYGYEGSDEIYSYAGNDKVYAGGGDDTISTAQGNDLIEAGAGNDTVYLVPDRKPRFFKKQALSPDGFFCAFRLFPGDLWAGLSVAARYR